MARQPSTQTLCYLASAINTTAMTPPETSFASSTLRASVISKAWMAALIVSLLLITTDSWLRLQRIYRVTNAPGFEIREDDPLQSSATGSGVRTHKFVLFNGALDSFHWIMQTEQMFATGDARIRHVDYDNAPAGRDVHWASLYRWWIGSLAHLLKICTDRPLPECIAIAAFYSNPLLLAIALLVATPWLALRAGSFPAAIFCLGMTGVLPVFDSFNASAPDHHGLSCLCAIFTLLFLLIAQSTPPRHNDAGGDSGRLYIILSGLAGGIGLWVSAAAQIIVLAGIGVGIVCSLLLEKRQRLRQPPRLWLTWAFSGAITSLICYAIEYLPGNASWRLEVNHPVFAFAWLGAGQLLCTLARWRSGEPILQKTPISVLTHIGAVLMLAAPLLVILAKGNATFLVSDPFLWKVHKNYIDEFRSIAGLFAQGWNLVSISTLLPLAMLFAASVPYWNDSVKEQRALLTLTFVPGIGIAFLALQQIRWFDLAYGLILTGFVFTTTLSLRKPLTVAKRWLVFILVLIAFCGQPLRTCLVAREDKALNRFDLLNLQIRDLSQWLHFRSGDKPVIVAGSPNLTTPLIYYGGLHGLGTFYWENIEGLKTGAALFGASSSDEARKIITSHGITHIVLASWDNFVGQYASLALGKNTEDTARCFGVRLTKNRSLTPWLRLIPYQLPGTKPGDSDEVLIFEVVPDQTYETAVSNFVHYYLDMNLPQIALKLLTELERDPQNLQLGIARARIFFAVGDRAHFASAVSSLPITETQTATLTPEQTIHLAALLAVAGRQGDSRAQGSAAIARLDQTNIRTLSPSAAYYLILLVRQHNLVLPDNLQRIALKLLSTEMRKQLASQ